LLWRIHAKGFLFVIPAFAEIRGQGRTWGLSALALFAWPWLDFS
jgi:hypothetical protein